MLHVEHLTCGYGPNPLQNPVVKDVSFSVSPGERLCILGPNGCGEDDAAARRVRPAPL